MKYPVRTHTLSALGMMLMSVPYALLAQGVAQGVAQNSLVEQVIVTARKRSEPATAVPMSFNVIDATTIDTFRIRNLADLAPLAHNVALFEDFPGAGIPTWIIRGVGLQDFNSNNTPAAAVHVDGVYQPSTVMGNAALFDMAQAEILKGPQGGLYGRNTTGGAVLLQSKRADASAQDYALSLTHGSWQQSQADAMANVPVSANAALRIAARIEDGNGGWQRSLVTGDEHGVKQRYDVRSWLHWAPSDSWTFDWKLQGGSEQSDIMLGRSVGMYDAVKTKTYCAAVLRGERDDRSCVNFGAVNRLVAGKPQLIENLALQADDGSSVWSSPFNTQSNDYAGTLLQAEWQGERFTLKSLTAYDLYNYGVALDLDGSAGEFGHRLSSSDIEVFSQELQIQSLPGSDLTWLAGMVFSDEKFSENRDFNLRDFVIRPLGRGKLNYLQTTKSQALYADISHALSDRWSINGTLRYTHEDKQYRNGDFYIPLARPVYLVQDLAADYSLDEHVSGSIALDYRYDAATLLYAKVAHGFKSGGFYGGFPFSAIEIEPYGAETLLAYEAGIKRSLSALDMQINAAVFTYDYRDVQGFVRDINPILGTGVDRLANQADARHDGAELELQWTPSQQWQVLAMIGWLDAKLVDATRKTTNVAGQQVLMEGTRPYAPRWSGNLQLLHRQVLAAGGTLQWALAYQLRSDFAGYQSSPIDAAVNKLPGYGRVDASLSWSAAQSHWQWMLWTRNLTDKTYRTRVKSDGLDSYVEFFGEPRAVGLTASWRY